jgi:dTMP kinase
VTTGQPDASAVPPPAEPAAHDLRGVLRIAPFRRLWVALSLSSLGDWLGLLATTALATELVHGTAVKLYAFGGVLALRLVPAVVIGPFAGAFADRFDRRKTMVLSDVLRAALFVSIPLVRTLPWLLAASFLAEALSLFFIPAKEASVPNLVPRERLEAANQLSLLTTYGSAAVGAVAFSLLNLLASALATGFDYFKTGGVDLALYVDAGTFLVSAVTVAGLRQIRGARRRDDTTPHPSFLRSIAEGWAFVGSTRWLRGLVIGILGATGAGAVVIGLSKPFVVDLHAGNIGYGALFATLFIGLAAGMLAGPRVLRGLSRRRLMGLAIFAAGISLALDAIMPNLLLAIALTFCLGGFAGIAWVVGMTLVGGEVDDERRGRTFAFLYNLMQIVLLAVLASAPFIAGAIGKHPVRVTDAVHLRVDGVTIVLFVAGLVGAGFGVACLRMMDDRPGVSLARDLKDAVRRPVPSTGERPAGCFVAFEGGEGAGKSTQVRLLARWLRGAGYDVVETREPGATEVGRQLRAVLLDRGNSGLSARSEALLYAADRAEHVSGVIRPALERGAMVLTDRYADSSLAYQGAGRVLPHDEVERLSAWATGGLAPDVTVLLDADPSVGLARRAGPADRIESETLDFHHRVRERFRDLAAREPDRYLVLDATRPVDEVALDVRQRVAVLLPAVPGAGRDTAPVSAAAGEQR